MQKKEDFEVFYEKIYHHGLPGGITPQYYPPPEDGFLALLVFMITLFSKAIKEVKCQGGNPACEETNK